MSDRFWAWMFHWLIAHVPYKQLGWAELGEVFYRFQFLKTPWFNVYLHCLHAPVEHPQCHSHPWHFWTWILAGGYWETVPSGTHWRKPGTLLFRTARSVHNVRTHGVCWSLVLTSWKVREWEFIGCKPSATKEEVP